MRSFFLAAIAGVSFAQTAVETCKTNISNADSSLKAVQTTCIDQGSRLGALRGDLAPLTTVLPYLNEQVINNDASINAIEATNVKSNTVLDNLEAKLEAVQQKIADNMEKISGMHMTMMGVTALLDRLTEKESEYSNANSENTQN